MQRTTSMKCPGATCSVGAAPGRRFYVTRTWRPIVTTSATRGDWRAAIEGSGSGDAAPSNAISNGAGGVERRSTTTTTTVKEPAAAKPAAASAANAAAAEPPVSPWAAPAPPKAAAKAAAPKVDPAALKATTGATIPPAAAAAAGSGGSGDTTESRDEPLSLPTIDVLELLAQPSNQALAYTCLASLSAILSVLCIVEPDAVMTFLLPKASTSDLDETFVRVLGVTLAASASVEYSLKHAAESQLLKSATYQRLMAGLALKSGGFLAVLLAYTPATFRLWSPLLWLAYAGTAVASAGINLAVISNSSGKGLAPPPLDFGTPQNATSWGYTACLALYLLTVAACFAPETLFTGDPYSAITPLVKGNWAPGFMLAAVMSFVLKDAADRNRLGASTFKNLNLGLAALEYGYSIIFGSAILSDQVDIDLPALSNLGGSLLIATFALYTYATAKK